MSSASKSQMTQAENINQLRELVKGIQYGMLTTLSEQDGAFRSRPLTLQQAEFDGAFWFFVAKSSSLVRDVLSNMRVNLAFSDPSKSAYVSVSGVAFLVEDRVKAEELWNPMLKAWFPKGVQDPDLALLRVHVECADYWDVHSGKLVQLVGFAKALLTGKRADGELGHRGHVEMGERAS